jgi:hypothetical protein
VAKKTSQGNVAEKSGPVSTKLQEIATSARSRFIGLGVTFPIWPLGGWSYELPGCRPNFWIESAWLETSLWIFSPKTETGQQNLAEGRWAKR